MPNLVYRDSLQILRRVIVNYTELIHTVTDILRRKKLLHHRSIVEEAEVTWLHACNMIDDMTAYMRFRDIRAFRLDKDKLDLTDGHEHIIQAVRKEVTLLLEIQARTHTFPQHILVEAHKHLVYCQKHSKTLEWSSKAVLPLLIKCQKLLNATADLHR